MKLKILFVVFSFFPNSFGTGGFYPYGQSNGDTAVGKNDDSSSPKIPISTLFPFFNHQHNHLIVNTNGVISFLKTVSTFTPNPFPLDDDRRLIAIFWADVDTRNGGTVWYRESTNQTILNRATEEVRTYFPQFFRFQATWVFIATWDNVAFYGCSNCDIRNTFQEILITNGQHSFTVFNYGQIEWTTGTASHGDALTGLGGVPAQVGFNAGDGRVFYVVNASRTPDIISVNHMSNIGIPGKFAFRIDAAEIDNGGCNTWGTLMISPRYGPMLGGQYVVIGGPCMNPDDSIQILYSPIERSFSCRRESNYSVVCITPMFNLTGDIKIVLIIRNVNGKTRRHSGVYTIVNPAISNNPVRRHEPEKWINGQQYGISWDPQAFELRGSERIHIHLYTLKEHLNKQLVWEKSVLHDNINNRRQIFYISLYSEGYVGTILVTPAIQTEFDIPTRGIWSDIFAIVPTQEHSKQLCFSWLRNEVRMPGVSSDDLPPCPCTLQQALMDTARYQPDPDCNMINTRKQDLNCLYRADAQHCVRLSAPGPFGKDNVCCYGVDQNLIDSRIKEGGTLQRYHYLGGEGNVPYLTNFYYDVLPYLHCCKYGSSVDLGYEGISVFSECQDYLHFRNISSCFNYVPPRPGQYVRASVCTSFVAQVTNISDKVEVRLNSIRVADVIINGQTQDFSDVSWLRYRGVSVLNLPKYSGNSTGREIMVMFADLGVSFRILATQEVLNVMPIIGNIHLKGTVSGLLGDFDGIPTNDLILPNGNVLEPNATEEAIFQKFNTAWRIPSTDSLFTYPNGRKYADYNVMHAAFLPTFFTSVASSVTPEAVELCGNNTDCLFDFQVTGSKEIAQETLDFTTKLEEAEDAAVPVIACPMLRSTEGGVWQSNSTLENAKAVFICGMGYRRKNPCIPTICKNGTWSNFHPCFCEKILRLTPSSTLQPTHTATPVLNDNSDLLKSISSKVQMMWFTIGGGVIIIIIITLIASFVLCFKFRSRERSTRSTEGTSSSIGTIGSLSGYRKYTGGSQKYHGHFNTDRGQMYSDCHDDSTRSLPRYNVYENRAFRYSETDSRYDDIPFREQRHPDILY
ncbi:protein mesh-like isoform X2 [Ostrea edulis]|uniref:protein mesh-like isoform X2 n=1 Tax=Ostrea edulis TaxID=37623 RepID=UPI0024AF46D1|nr:protein mesh-like isoform X2 [Ostrea edulis]